MSAITSSSTTSRPQIQERNPDLPLLRPCPGPHGGPWPSRENTRKCDVRSIKPSETTEAELQNPNMSRFESEWSTTQEEFTKMFVVATSLSVRQNWVFSSSYCGAEMSLTLKHHLFVLTLSCSRSSCVLYFLLKTCVMLLRQFVRSPTRKWSPPHPLPFLQLSEPEMVLDISCSWKWQAG